MWLPQAVVMPYPVRTRYHASWVPWGPSQSLLVTTIHRRRIKDHSTNPYQILRFEGSKRGTITGTWLYVKRHDTAPANDDSIRWTVEKAQGHRLRR